MLEAQIVDGETATPVRPEGEKEFVKLHRVEKHTDPDRLRNPSFSGKVKKDTSAAGKEPKPGFPPNTGQKDYPANEETKLNEMDPFTAGLVAGGATYLGTKVGAAIGNWMGAKNEPHRTDRKLKRKFLGKKPKQEHKLPEETEPSWYVDEYGRPRRVGAIPLGVTCPSYAQTKHKGGSEPFPTNFCALYMLRLSIYRPSRAPGGPRWPGLLTIPLPAPAKARAATRAPSTANGARSTPPLPVVWPTRLKSRRRPPRSMRA